MIFYSFLLAKPFQIDHVKTLTRDPSHDAENLMAGWLDGARNQGGLKISVSPKPSCKGR